MIIRKQLLLKTNFNEMEDKSDQEKKIKQYLELQLSELEMLNSMYPRSDELKITVPAVVADMTYFIEDKSTIFPNQLDYSLFLDIAEAKDKLELNVCLPYEYPDVEPKVYARSSALNRTQQKELNTAISNFLTEYGEGELCIGSLVAWVSDNASKYFSLKTSQNMPTVHRKEVEQDTFSRMWIYSHHIYSKEKRRSILEYGHDLKLTGFSLPGKPGIICVEGFSKDCSTFFQNLKQLSWKKMSLTKEETVRTDNCNIDELRNFDAFQEISFQVRRGPAREYHMDMGDFYKYLDSHNCSYAFHDFFGVDGRGPENSKT